MESGQKKVSFGIAILNMVIILICVGVGGGVYKTPLDMSFMMALTLIAVVVMITNRYKAAEILEFFFEGCRKSIEIDILIIGIGAVMGAWIVSGIVPTLIYYGLKFISPTYFLVSGFVFLSTLSFFIGSAFATAGTVGVALMGIGMGMGYPAPVTAGMVMSGAIFGNKISPFADSTNLCVVSTGVNLLDHIKSMCYSVIPIFFASAAVYTYLGFFFAGGQLDQSNITLIMEIMDKHFAISPLLLLVPLLTIVLIFKKVPPVIALLLSTLAGALAAFAIQHSDIKTVASSISEGFSIKTGTPQVDKLLNRGGVFSMLDVVEVVLFLMGGGEILQRTGTTAAIMSKLAKVIRGSTSLVLTTLFAGFMVDAVTASQYLSIILPGEMFKKEYERFRIKLTVLSRTLEDSGTIFSYLIPWSNNAVIMSGIIGVSTTASYIYAYQLWFSPILAIIFAITGIAVWKETGPEPSVSKDSAPPVGK